MIKRHPTSRAERLRLKQLKDTFDTKSGELSKLRKRKLEELKAKELEDELRFQVSSSQEEAGISANQV